MELDPLSRKIFVLTITALIYGFSIGVYEFYFGGEVTRLIELYRDAVIPADDSFYFGISIRHFPGDLYKDMTILAPVMFIIGSSSILVSIVVVSYNLYYKELDEFAKSVIALNLLVILLPFSFCVYLTIKLHSLSVNDIELWNFIDARFVENLRISEKLMFGTGVPGLVFLILSFVLHRMNEN